jgi:hypothetical protein
MQAGKQSKTTHLKDGKASSYSSGASSASSHKGSYQGGGYRQQDHYYNQYVGGGANGKAGQNKYKKNFGYFGDSY